MLAYPDEKVLRYRELEDANTSINNQNFGGTVTSTAEIY